MSIQQFVTLGFEPRRAGLVRGRAERANAIACMERIGLEMSPDTPMGELPPSEARAVLIAQALHRRAQVLLLDEPTAGMSLDQASVLCSLMRSLCEQGLSLLFVSHRLNEVERTCDSVTLMKDGRTVETLEGTKVTIEAMVQHLTSGEQAPSETGLDLPIATEPLIEVHDLDLLHSRVSLTVRRGEVLGIAGLPGSGVEDVFAALSGASRPGRGCVMASGRSVRSPEDAISAGLAYLPPRRSEAAFLDASVTRNVAIASLSRLSVGGFITRQREASGVKESAEQVNVEPLLDRPMSSLSGGNQQRALIARLLATGADVILLEDPTLGVDIQARAAIHELLIDLARTGKTCVVGSSEPEELASICSRILVFRSGSLVDELTDKRINERNVIEGITAQVAVA
jgi:ABC-type sugar transport system ATPase subunit